MKKRLRKKKHLKEFAEFGREITVKRNTSDNADAFLDWFIDSVIEANNCSCGGGFTDNSLSIIVALGTRDSDPQSKLTTIVSLLESHPEVSSVEVGPEIDLWYPKNRLFLLDQVYKTV